MKIVAFLITLISPQILLAQKIDNTASFRDIPSESYFRFNYDNDYFASSDKNYTQGYSFELASRWLAKNPANYLFLKPAGEQYKYGIAIEHIGFTPENYKSTAIQYGDRPFAAAIMLKSFMVATDTLHALRISSALNVGLIGSGAFGKEMQVAIHEGTGNAIPQGWQHQIRNDIVLNYEVSLVKQLWRYRSMFAIEGNAAVRAGTLFTSASVGASAMLGIINTPFEPMHKQKQFQLYLYSQPLINAIGYDATLQGGLFNNKSPYTIAAKDLERFTAQHNYGIVLQAGGLYFEYARAVLTKEFNSDSAAKWGGVKVGFVF